MGGNPGYYIAARPRPYKKTAQQLRAATRAADCGIKSGISKAELQRGMKCIKFMSQGKSADEAKKMAGATG